MKLLSFEEVIFVLGGRGVDVSHIRLSNRLTTHFLRVREVRGKNQWITGWKIYKLVTITKRTFLSADTRQFKNKSKYRGNVSASLHEQYESATLFLFSLFSFGSYVE